MKNTMLIAAGTLLLCGLTVAGPASESVAAGDGRGSASIPTLINYQGILTDDTGQLVPDGTYRMEFRIYEQAVGGTALWSEVHEAVSVAAGIFNVVLGSNTSLPIETFSEAARYLGVAVETDPEMAPRERLTSVPYAYHSGYAGIRYYVPVGNNSVDIPIPHHSPFQIIMGELGGTPDDCAWMTGSENDHSVRFLGIDGSGAIVRGSCTLYNQCTILTVRDGLVLRTKGDGSYTLVLDSSGHHWESAAVLYAPYKGE